MTFAKLANLAKLYVMVKWLPNKCTNFNFYEWNRSHFDVQVYSQNNTLHTSTYTYESVWQSFNHHMQTFAKFSKTYNVLECLFMYFMSSSFCVLYQKGKCLSCINVCSTSWFVHQTSQKQKHHDKFTSPIFFTTFYCDITNCKIK